MAAKPKTAAVGQEPTGDPVVTSRAPEPALVPQPGEKIAEFRARVLEAQETDR